MSDKATEHILLQFPNNPEIFLSCIAVLQSYVEELRKRNIEPVLHCAVAELWNIVFLREALTCKIEASEFDLPADRYDAFELVHSFDGWHALHMCERVEKHVTQALGILIGAEPKSLPDLAMLWAAKVPMTGVLIVQPEQLPKLGEYIVRAGVKVNGFTEGVSVDARIYGAMCADVVVGFRSVETYAAAAAGRYVLELYPAEDYPKQWLSKWGCKNYRMVYGTREKLTSEMAWNSLELLLKKKVQDERAEKWRLTRRPERVNVHPATPAQST